MASTMRKSVSYLTLCAAGLLVACIVLRTAGLISPVAVRFLGSLFTLDPVSFSAGMLGGLTLVWLAAVPWSALPQFVARLALSWRRNFILASLVALCAGVLLFY